ncbi:MAG: type II toxin-antitoxin system Phd/YefM family antitoxin [Thermoanaerobaculia bacterium]|nr:type II toxin-antitoxin system Phd/YefM family antitoxin [Thermoanaerobaculia bacterium]
MRTERVAEEHRPVAELAADVAGTVRHVHETGRAVVLTQGERDVAVLLSVEAFERMQAASERLALQAAVDEAERGIAAGDWVEHAEVEAKLRRWAVGEA